MFVTKNASPQTDYDTARNIKTNGRTSIDPGPIIIPRLDTAANFTANNPTLDLNEIAFESDTGKYKKGDGSTAWASLSYYGSVPTLATARSIYGNNFDGSAALAQIIASTFGGTGNGFTKFTGPATSEKTFTLPNATATVLTDNAAVTVAQGGTGRATATTAYGLIAAGTTATGVQQTVSPGTSGHLLKSAGASALPAFSAGTGSDVGLGNVDNTSDATKNSATATLTNKRFTKRVTAITSSGTPTINTDNCDAVDITALAADITSMTTNLSGTPTNKQMLLFEIKDDGTARAITWGASFVAGGAALPTTTVISKILTVGFVYSTANGLNKWRCIASAQEA